MHVPRGMAGGGVTGEHRHYDGGRGLMDKPVSPYITTGQLGATQKAAVGFQCDS